MRIVPATLLRALAASLLALGVTASASLAQDGPGPVSFMVFGDPAELAAYESLVAAFEDEFDIDMDEVAALKVKTVGDAVTFIETYLGD